MFKCKSVEPFILKTPTGSIKAATLSVKEDILEPFVLKTPSNGYQVR